MTVVVVGGGVVGLFSAYWLARSGAEVLLLERQQDVATETSAVSAGIMAPGHALSWASPALLRQVPGILRGTNQRMRIDRLGDPRLLIWGMRFLSHCTRRDWTKTSIERWKLVTHSLAALEEVVARHELEPRMIRAGAVFVHDSPSAVDNHYSSTHILRELGAPVRRLGVEELVALEPALAVAHRTFAGGIFDPSALSGDCAAFAKDLRDVCIELGVEIRTGTGDCSLVSSGDAVQAVHTQFDGEHRADAVVVAAGAFTPAVFGPAGWRLGVYPVKGYGLTWLVDGGRDDLPRVPGVDEQRLVGWARYGDVLRFTGIAAFEGFSPRMSAAHVDEVTKTARELFPALGASAPAKVGYGFRAITPDGLPRVGRFGFENAYVNTGHGNLGWTLSAGSGLRVCEAVLR